MDFGVSEGLAALTALGADAGIGGAAAAGATATAPVLSGVIGGVTGGAAAAAAGGGLASTLSSAASVAGLAGTGLSAVGQLSNAAATASQEKEAAAEEGNQANQAAAAAERTEITRDRQTQLVLSRTQAEAASSGGGATDPTVLSLEGTTEQQGDYNALSSLYQGQAASRADQLQQQIDLFKAAQTETAAPIAAAGTVLSGVSSFANRFATLKAMRAGLNPFAFSGS